MNLVERLGGYEKAKDHRDYLIDFGNEFNRPNKYEVNKINNALLEHRRQHNIFEVGDKVKAKDHQFGFDELFRIDDFFANDDGVNLAVLDDGDCYPISFLEHATDEEIKAGKRLEVNDGSIAVFNL